MEIIDLMKQAGLKLIQLKSDKTPVGKWKDQDIEITDQRYVGLVCGEISGGIEGIDFDLKYDLTGTLITRYKEIVKELAPTLLNRLVIQKTINNGFHLIYRCSKIEGNQKLANRPTSEEEKEYTYKLNIDKGKSEDEALKAKKNDKVRVLIETRGEGGYFMVYPSIGYALAKGSFDNIPTITEEERDILINTAKSFNETLTEYSHPKKTQVDKQLTEFNVTPLDDFNERGDVVSTLLENGWSVVMEKGDKVFVKRSGHTTSLHSGNYDKRLRWFSVFSTSTEFEPQRAYNPASVFAILECNGDFSRAAAELYARGYGTRREEVKVVVKEKKEIVIDENLSFLEDEGAIRSYIESIKNGTLQMGYSTGIPSLDKHFLFKRQQFNIINGFDNVGKTTIMIYLLLMSSIVHDWKWGIVSNENRNGSLRSKLMEFYMMKKLNKMNSLEYKRAYEFVQEHFFMVKNDALYTHNQVLEMGSALVAKKSVDGILIDPFNSLLPKIPHGMNSHDYQYQQLSEMRVWTKQEDAIIFLNTHTNSLALRAKDPKGNPIAPNKGDSEGGTKFPSKADDFLTFHRNTKDPLTFMDSEIHVQKVKDTDTGGQVTYGAEPIILRMTADKCSFIDSKANVNPIDEALRKQNVQLVVPMEVEKSTKIRENNNFLNQTQDEYSEFTQFDTSDDEPAPF